VQLDWINEMLLACKEFEDAERDRINFLKSLMSEYAAEGTMTSTSFPPPLTSLASTNAVHTVPCRARCLHRAARHFVLMGVLSALLCPKLGLQARKSLTAGSQPLPRSRRGTPTSTFPPHFAIISSMRSQPCRPARCRVTCSVPMLMGCCLVLAIRCCA